MQKQQAKAKTDLEKKSTISPIKFSSVDIPAAKEDQGRFVGCRRGRHTSGNLGKI
ncbi:MAG: hypothetical protein ACOX1A_00395 [Saccharofermentanales bacterium]